MITTDKYSLDHFTVFQYNNSWDHKWYLLVVDDMLNRVVEEVPFDRRLIPDEVKKYLDDYVVNKRKGFK